MNKITVNIIGNGSLGSATAVLLAKLLPNHIPICLIDFDLVEEHNLENQFFGPQDIGKCKPQALKETLKKFGRENVSVIGARVNKNVNLEGIVVALVDSMEARKDIFSVCRSNAGVLYLIEARSGGDTAYVYGLDPRDPDSIVRYAGSLYSDDDSLPAPCATRETTPILFTVASVVGHMLNRFFNVPRHRLGLTFVVINSEDLQTVETQVYSGYNVF